MVPPTSPLLRKIDAEQILRDDEQRWRRWTRRLKYKGQYREAVVRSLITLRAMIYRPTGGIVAAVTTSLPESLAECATGITAIAGCATTTFTLLALANAGYLNEAAAWQDWLLRALAGSPEQVQIMYGLKGERQLVEWEVVWLSGYENSSPVRIGNAASTQVQLDIYGEMLDCFFHAQHSMRRHAEDDFRVLVLLLEHLETIWREPDEGIWETRGEPQQFTHSKMMAWVAFDRAVLLAEQLITKLRSKNGSPFATRFTAKSAPRAFSKKMNSFVQAYGSEQLDAALLLMPLVGFLPGSDPRVKGTVEAIERELMPAGLVMRYDTANVDDGLPPGEGVFLACSFWMVSGLKAIGREATHERSLNGCSRCETTSACSRKSTTPGASDWSAIFPRPSRILRWSTRHLTWETAPRPANALIETRIVDCHSSSHSLILALHRRIYP